MYAGELGIYYRDLYHLIKPIHDVSYIIFSLSVYLISFQHKHPAQHSVQGEATAVSSATSSPEAHCIQTSPNPHAQLSDLNSKGSAFSDPIIPPINTYGTFQYSQDTSGPGQMFRRRSFSRGSSFSGNSEQSQHFPLLPSSRPPENDSVMGKISGDLIPFSSLVTMIKLKLTGHKRSEVGVS